MNQLALPEDSGGELKYGFAHQGNTHLALGMRLQDVLIIRQDHRLDKRIGK